MTAFFYCTITVMALFPAILVPRDEWNLECWFFSVGAVWLLFMLGPLAELIRWLT